MRTHHWLLSLPVVATLALAACGGGAAPSAAPASSAPAPAASKPAASAPVSAAASAKPAASAAASASAKPAASASGAAAASGGAKPTVRVGGFNFPESTVLVELYSQALEGSGYKVERKANLGNREIVEPALEKGDIDLVPEYMNTLLLFVDKNSKGSSDPAEDQKLLQTALTPKNLTVLDYSPAVDSNGFVVAKATADKNKLKKMSDLTPVAPQMILGGPPECPQRPFCLMGLQNTYGLKFKDFKPLDAGGPLTVAALEGNQVQVALLFTTDPNIITKGFVLLDDDKHLQQADNVAAVVRNDLLSKAGTDFKTAVNGVSAKLTTANLTDLDKQVGVDKKDAKEVAAAWLKSNGLAK